MRISDWSSDVCSSDLRHMADQHIIADDQRAAIRVTRARRIAMEHASVLDIGALADADAEYVGAQHAIVPDRASRPDLDIADDREIGRASCRERVCQYV